MFKGIGDLTSMLKQASQMGSRMKEMSEELKHQRASGSAGGGMVEIEVNGLMEVLGCRIDPELVRQGDVELLEDLVASAVNQAVEKAKQVHADSLRGLTGGINLPGLNDAFANFFGKDMDNSPPPEAK